MNASATSPTNASTSRHPTARSVIESALGLLLILLLLRGVVQNVKIDGSSMEPTLHHGQYILVNRLTYFHIDANLLPGLLLGSDKRDPRQIYPFGIPQRGDTVVFHAPNEGLDYIKRVVGLPGDHIVIREGRVYINGQPLEEPYLTSSTECTGASAHCDTIVPADSIYVLGDNRQLSSDSRQFGALPLERVIGKAWLSYWPREYWSVITTPIYAVDQTE